MDQMIINVISTVVWMESFGWKASSCSSSERLTVLTKFYNELVCVVIRHLSIGALLFVIFP